ncbi:3-deoxy-7-phosphoheptulonate synthase [Dickeya zeae]|uniref:3-deoxy-7-phosphoheptulonate synthase n=1 Tax=Dickeya zeae TaxID=204042 RepID=UPI0020968114|nr:3-deoxy-7-phosphoheptulonate synthase [Dickeya zeae]MCO7262384.1 3-deoxy-7-phosphoheptulonate synthase [Dickeya zeae]
MKEMEAVACEKPNWQQPEWENESELIDVTRRLQQLPPLISHEDLIDLYKQLEQVWLGKAMIFQAGDCAERISECDNATVFPKVSFLYRMSQMLTGLTGLPVVTVGRIAGQYAKPRSQYQEICAEGVLPVWRGDCVNRPEATAEARCPLPGRMLLSYHAAARTLDAIYDYRNTTRQPLRRVWTSHEALLLDYERAQVRPLPHGRRYLSSTHWPWIGIRTLDLAGPHIALLSQMDNPIACKISEAVSPAMLIQLCRQLNPRKIPGRLTFIARFGASKIRQLGRSIDAVMDTGIPVLWMCDPMHGNTRKTTMGNKRRDVSEMMAEIAGFQQQVAERNACCAGLHLETTADDIAECFGAGYQPDEQTLQRVLCDPRLNAQQTSELLTHWKNLRETL